MSGRRSHSRFNISPSSDGVLRVLRDVTVQRTQEDELLVIGREAGVVGDQLTLEVSEPNAPVRATVQVVESLPIIINGAVRHRLRLRPVAAPRSLSGPTVFPPDGRAISQERR